MNWSVIVRNLTVGVLVGGLLGLVVGLLLVGLTDSVDNPFWAMSIGMGVGAAMSVTTAVGHDLDNR